MTHVADRIQTLLPRHFKIIDLASAGHDSRTIAQTLGMQPATISMILKSPLVQAEIARIRADNREASVLGMDRDAVLGKARSILEQACEKAAKKHEELLESPDASIQLRAASSILDRVYGKTGEQRSSLVVNITGEQIQLLSLALKESDNARFLPTHSPRPSDPEVINEQSVVCRDDGSGRQGVRRPDGHNGSPSEDQSSDVHSGAAECTGPG